MGRLSIGPFTSLALAVRTYRTKGADRDKIHINFEKSYLYQYRLALAMKPIESFHGLRDAYCFKSPTLILEADSDVCCLLVSAFLQSK